MHEGHRKRMYERIASGDSLQEHEILEVLLYFVIPRQNTNGIAHELIDACGNLREVFRTEPEKLKTLEGVGDRTANFLKTIGLILERILSCRMSDLPSAYNADSFMKYVIKRFEFAEQEYAELYAIKRGGAMSFCRRFSSEESDRVRIPAEEIAKFVATFRPKEVILVHNHVCANFNPSDEDNYFTKYISVLLSFYGVRLIDHVIVSKAGCYSYFAHGEMNEIQGKFNVKNVMEALK